MWNRIKAVMIVVLLMGGTLALAWGFDIDPSYSDEPGISQDDLTPWAYLPHVRRDPLPTPTLAPPDVRITQVVNDAPGNFPINREYVLIENLGGSAQNMDGWQLADQAQGGQTFTFPGNLSTLTLDPGASVKVWSTHGTDTTENLYWRMLLQVWDDLHDTAYLRDDTGTLVSSYSY